jgi:capsular polysaccharide biosynthesis protein
MDDDLTESEREQLQKFVAHQRIAAGILLKWGWLLALVFAVLFLAFAGFLVWHSASSVQRFEATTRLLFTPRYGERVQNITDKQLASVLERSSLKRRVGRTMSMPHIERECLVADLEIKQERKPTNLFTLKAHSLTWVGAVKKVNAYAEVLIGEYISYRTRSLDAWGGSMEARKRGLQEQIAILEGEEAIEKGRSGVASPVETLTMLNGLLSDQRRNLSMLSVEIANEDVKKKKCEAAVGELGPAIIACAALIRQKSAEIAAIDQELTKLREVYTDLNPKVIGKVEDRAKLLEEYRAMLSEKGLDGIALEDLERVEKSARELADVTLRMEVLAESQRSLEQEIKSNEERSAALTSIIPSVERLRIKRTEIERVMRDLEEQLGEVDFLKMTAENDLQQIERAGGASEKNPLSLKNFILALAGALLCTLVLAFWLLLLELVFGKVRGAKELAAFGDVALIGSIPKPGAMTKDHEHDVLGVLALNFCNIELPKNILLICRLPGAPEQPKFVTALDWSLSMAGQRAFGLNIVHGLSFEPGDDCELMINTVRRGSMGWFPVANRYALAPTELQMLQADIAALRGEFDIVFMMMPEGLTRGGNFFSQLLSVCDSAVVMVGANETPRAELSYTRRHIKASGKPMMGLVTGVSARVVKREMEEKR